MLACVASKVIRITWLSDEASAIDPRFLPKLKARIMTISPDLSLNDTDAYDIGDLDVAFSAIGTDAEHLFESIKSAMADMQKFED
jgi:hypothetical protein